MELSITPNNYKRKVDLSQAIQIDLDNIDQVAQWCGGAVRIPARKSGDSKWIRLNDGTNAYPEGWIVKEGEVFSYFTDEAFNDTFDYDSEGEVPNGGIRPPL